MHAINLSSTLPKSFSDRPTTSSASHFTSVSRSRAHAHINRTWMEDNGSTDFNSLKPRRAPAIHSESMVKMHAQGAPSANTTGIFQPRSSRCGRLLLVLTLCTCLLLSPRLVCGQSTFPSNITSSSSTMSVNGTLLSPGGVFEVGFSNRTPTGATSPVYVLAIWYAQTTSQNTVVWVANRSMVLSSQAKLTLSAQGDLQVSDVDAGGQVIVAWTSKTANLNVTTASIRDTGNFVLVNDANQVVWQSFDNPTDTLLPNQSYGPNTTTTITAWESNGDWSNGNYSLPWHSNTNNLSAIWQVPYQYSQMDNPQIQYWPISMTASSHVLLTSAGVFEAAWLNGTRQQLGSPKTDVASGTTLLLRLTLGMNGNLRLYSWTVGRSSTWFVEWRAVDDCDIPGFCGPYALCSNSTCSCPTKDFNIVDPNDQRLGCKRIESLESCSNCTSNSDMMVPAGFADWPMFPPFSDLQYKFEPNGLTEEACCNLCLKSSSCVAAVTTLEDSATMRVNTCWLKREPLLTGYYTPIRQGFIRVAGNSTGSSQSSTVNTFKIVAAVLGAVVVILGLLLCACGWRLCSRKVGTLRKRRLQEKWMEAKGSMVKFSYREIALMTENFAAKIGEGGCGTVFMGHVGDTPVAVKRLIKDTSRVEQEFLQEVESIGTIHHIHLVSLLGYCAEGRQKILVYEYVERGSLDRALFRAEKRGPSQVLDWRSRFAIAIQTARGLAYLHEDCKQRIIHCDVKPENILLDSVYSAKVADFGLSRILSRDQTGTVTSHIRGTTGYLAPEWTNDQVAITSKTDVFSYGMVLLEIVSGRRNLRTATTDFDAPDVYFPTWAFPKLDTDRLMEVVDQSLLGFVVDRREVQRALQVAFWCINEKPQLRPSMNEVVQMLQGLLPIPLPVQQPAFLDTLVDCNVEGLTWTQSNRLNLYSSNSTSSSLEIDQENNPASKPFLSSGSRTDF